MKLMQTRLVACVAAVWTAQTSPPAQALSAKALEQQLQNDSTTMPEMTAE
jgi:hypothetical protein